jgi:hypothetical protein
MKAQKNTFQQKLQLDQETKQKLQKFVPQMEEWKNKSAEESEFAQAVVCGPKEFEASKTKPKKLQS